MAFASNTVRITGGGTGIGFALAERFVKAGSCLIICGRREHRLKEASGCFYAMYMKLKSNIEDRDIEPLRTDPPY